MEIILYIKHDIKTFILQKNLISHQHFSHGRQMIFISLFVPFFAYLSHLLNSSSATPRGLFAHNITITRRDQTMRTTTTKAA